MKKSIVVFLTAIVLTTTAATSFFAAYRSEPQKKKTATSDEKTSRAASDARNTAYLVKAVRKELVTIPYYGVFDWLEGNVEPDGTVYLRGEVVKPTTKSDAERRVKKIEGVDKVVNEIEVLPLSSNDDQLRTALFRTLFNSGSPLFRYGQGTVPSIHIIIKNGRLTLKGVVSTKSDSDLAKIKASTISGLFEVKNELSIETARKKKK